LLLWRLAPDCDAYFGTDFAAVVVERLQRQLAERSDLAHVQVRQGLADDPSVLPVEPFDTIDQRPGNVNGGQSPLLDPTSDLA
jgi:hypothetical protein